MITFPPNPSDGMIYEAEPGLFFQYSAKDNTWVRIDGYAALGIATQSLDGLMSSEDFTKLNDLLVPPPRISLTSDDCSFTFDSGIIGFRSSKEHLNITSDIELKNTVDGAEIVDIEPWQIHENTFGYEFKVNMDKIIEDMQGRGSLTTTATRGAQGRKGEDGLPGINDLKTGPQGEDGEDGANAPFQGSLSPDGVSDFELIGKDNRAIVDVTARESTDSYDLLAIRANIGNIDACPNRVIPRDFLSPFIIGSSKNPNSDLKRIVNSDGSVTCQVCSDLYHLDVRTIENQVFNRFKELVLEMKEVKELLVNDWLATLISVFNQQKEALCCALENCESRKRNQNERRYIEQQRIQAAQGNFSLNIDGAESRQFTDMNENKDCPAEGGQAFQGDPDECLECALELVIDGRANAGSPKNGVVANLAAGSYVAEIVDCCIEFRENRWNGQIRLEYQTGDDRTSNKRTVGEVYDDIGIITIPNLGDKLTDQDAKATYLGMSFAFTHAGGEVNGWYPDPIEDDNSGSVTICIRKSECLEFPEGTDDGDEITADPYDDFEMCCPMLASQLAWYERGWRIGACCGAFLEIEGIKYIVVKRSLGADTTCGGGESTNTECIDQAISSGLGHPAIAYQSVDGDEFVGLRQTGVQNFALIEDLSEKAVNKIQIGDVISTKGNPAANIDIVLFPATDAFNCSSRVNGGITDTEGRIIFQGLSAQYFWDVSGTIPVPGGDGETCLFDFGTYPESGKRTDRIDFADRPLGWNAQDGDWPPIHPEVEFRTNRFAVRWAGEILIEESGEWDLRFRHDDGVRLFLATIPEDISSIESKLDDFTVGDKYTSISSADIISLGSRTAGWYPMAIECFADLGNSAIMLEFRGPGDDYFRAVPSENLRIVTQPTPENPDGYPPLGNNAWAYGSRNVWDMFEDVFSAVGKIASAIGNFFGDLFGGLF